MKFYLVIRPSLKGTVLPVYYYTFGTDEGDAQRKVEMKWGEFDEKTQVREISGKELDQLVIAIDNYFG